MDVEYHYVFTFEITHFNHNTIFRNHRFCRTEREREREIEKLRITV